MFIIGYVNYCGRSMESIVDEHFGLMSCYFNSYCKMSKTGLFDTKDLGYALLTGHNEARRLKQHMKS